MFTDIRLIREDNNGNLTLNQQVPLTYAAKDKLLQSVIQDPAIDRSVALNVPIMSFEMSGMQYDGDRKFPSTNKRVVKGTNKDQLLYQYNPVPYNINFKLFILVKNQEDGVQLIERILPYFTPALSVNMTAIHDTNVTYEIPIILNGIAMSDPYDGKNIQRREIMYELDFTMKYYIYGAINKTAIIKKIDINFYTPTIDDLKNATSNSVVLTNLHIEPGLDANNNPTSIKLNSIPVANISSTDNFGFITTITDN